MEETTTIEISRRAWKRLNARKEPGQSFNDVVVGLLDAAGGDD